MSMDQWEVLDGPLTGEIFALQAEDRQQIKLRVDDGRVAVYSAKLGKSHGVPNQLLFVGIDASSRLQGD